jgi:teichoic acid transport system ATP-binding protein
MNDTNDLAVKVSGLTKSYKLYASPRDRLKETFNPFGKTYHKAFNALENLTIEIPRGSTTGIIGRNGSGKSTLLQCICGIVTPTSGEVEVNGRIAALLELGAGFNPDFNGRDNIYMNGAILGLDNESIDARLDDILAFADIGEYIDQPVRTYSSGMFVRLAFSIAIHVDPEILIVDEALAVGDIQFQSRCFDKFHQFREQGTTVIFVTHDLNMVTRYCDQAYLLSHGSIVGQGNPRAVVARYRKIEVGYDASEEKGPDSEDDARHLFDENPYEVRYGDNRATIHSGGIFDANNEPVQTLDSGEHYSVKMTVKFEDTIADPVFAFTIKDVKGTEIAGTNTRFANMETGTFEPGQSVTITFDQAINLNAGSYLLSLGCVDIHPDGLKIYDRRHDFLAFQVITDKAIVGIVDLGSRISISDRR